MALLKKHLFALVFIVILTASCSKYYFNRPHFMYNRNIPNSAYLLVDQFRFETCLAILKEAYRGTNTFNELAKKDLLSQSSDGVLSKTHYIAIDSIVNDFLYEGPTGFQLSKEIVEVPDYPEEYTGEQIDSYYTHARFERRLIFMAVLDFYESYNLDSLARHYLKISPRDYKKVLRETNNWDKIRSKKYRTTMPWLSFSDNFLNRPEFLYDGTIPYVRHMFVDRFRYEVAISILHKSFLDTRLFKEMLKKDYVMPSTEFFMSDNYYTGIDSITRNILYHAPKATLLRNISDNYKINLQEQGLELDEKDSFLRFIFNFHESHDLDSLAKQYLKVPIKEYKRALKEEYKHYQKIKKENRQSR